MKEYQNELIDLLEKLISTDSPCGYHQKIVTLLNDELKSLGLKPKNLIKGGVSVCISEGHTPEGNSEGSTGGPPLVLFAHVDTLGAVVQSIKANGRMSLSPLGGLNANNIETEQVKLVTRDGKEYEGTIQIANASVHVNAKANDPRKFTDTIELVLDEDVKKADDVKALGIQNGDYVLVNPRFTVTKSLYIKSRFLDDKASVACLLLLARMVSQGKVKPTRKVYLNFTVYEEIGHGASCGIPEDAVEAIAVDMGCVGDSVSCTEKQVSICAKDSGGPYHYELTSALIETAKKYKINYAVDVYPFYGSDVEASLRAGYDFKHALIGPGVYASHGYERTHIDGLTNTLELLIHYIE